MELYRFSDILYFGKISYLIYTSLRRELVRKAGQRKNIQRLLSSVSRGNAVYFNLNVDKKRSYSSQQRSRKKYNTFRIYSFLDHFFYYYF